MNRVFYSDKYRRFRKIDRLLKKHMYKSIRVYRKTGLFRLNGDFG